MINYDALKCKVEDNQHLEAFRMDRIIERQNREKKALKDGIQREKTLKDGIERKRIERE